MWIFIALLLSGQAPFLNDVLATEGSKVGVGGSRLGTPTPDFVGMTEEEVQPQGVHAKIVIGNTSLPSDLILKAFKEGPEGILNLYKTNGFLQAIVKVRDDTILVEEGPQFRVGTLKISGNQVFGDSELLSGFQASVFNESKFKENIDKIIKKYENSGYPYCKIEIDSFELKSDYGWEWKGLRASTSKGFQVNAWLHIFEGPLVRISNIKVDGNKFTKDYVILRELRIKRGDIFCEDKVREATQRVNRLEFIELVGTSLDNRDELCIRIKEKPASHIDGAFGYGKPGFIGLIDLELLNLIGTGRSICAKWHRRDTSSTFFELKYKEPWLFASPVNLIGSFSHRAEPSYVKNRAELLFNIPVTVSLTVNTGVSGTWVSHIYRYREILGLDFDTRCIPGVRYRVKSEWNLYKLEEVALNFDNYLGKANSLILFLSANFGAILREEIEIYDQLKLGGARNLRGYWEEEFSGTKVGWLNIELQKFISFGGCKQGVSPCFFPFYDVGYIDGGIKHSYGFGVSANSPIGVIKIVYGLAKGAGFMEGKIHISIKSTF